MLICRTKKKQTKRIPVESETSFSFIRTNHLYLHCSKEHNWLLFIMTAVQSPLPCCIFCTTLLTMFYLCRFSESRSSSGSTLSVCLSATLSGCLVCVICNSWSFHSFLFKLCILMAVHILKMCTSFFVHILLIFSHFLRVLDLRHFFHLKWVGGVWFV